VDATVKTLEASGVELTPAQKRELELVKLGLNPSRGQVEDGAISTATDAVKGK
jgi:hypothetical protein